MSKKSNNKKNKSKNKNKKKKVKDTISDELIIQKELIQREKVIAKTAKNFRILSYILMIVFILWFVKKRTFYSNQDNDIVLQEHNDRKRVKNFEKVYNYQFGASDNSPNTILRVALIATGDAPNKEETAEEVMRQMITTVQDRDLGGRRNHPNTIKRYTLMITNDPNAASDHNWRKRLKEQADRAKRKR